MFNVMEREGEMVGKLEVRPRELWKCDQSSHVASEEGSYIKERRRRSI